MAFNPSHNHILGSGSLFGGPRDTYSISKAVLEEIQKADLGRKFAKIDRRPLDPPPVVVLKLYTKDDGPQREVDPARQPPSVGRLCTVDLFPASSIEYKAALDLEQANMQASAPSSPTSPLRPGHSSSSQQPPSAEENPDRTFVTMMDDEPIYEYMKLTKFLVGQREAQPTVMDWEGSKSLMFVFNDLSVKQEGYFFLRYRTFDITSLGTDHLAEAECFGGKFRVYSTKEFPGLNASTDLTKELALRGVRVNVRESERKRRRRDALSSGEE